MYDKIYVHVYAKFCALKYTHTPYHLCSNKCFINDNTCNYCHLNKSYIVHTCNKEVPVCSK